MCARSTSVIKNFCSTFKQNFEGRVRTLETPFNYGLGDDNDRSAFRCVQTQPLILFHRRPHRLSSTVTSAFVRFHPQPHAATASLVIRHTLKHTTDEDWSARGRTELLMEADVTVFVSGFKRTWLRSKADVAVFERTNKCTPSNNTHTGTSRGT